MKYFKQLWKVWLMKKDFWSLEKPEKDLQCWVKQFWGPCYDNQILIGVYEFTHTLYFNYYTVFFSAKLSLEILEPDLGTSLYF